MKHLLLSLLLLVGLAGWAMAQTAHPTPQKDDNIILIQTPDSAATALRKLAQVFVGQGYTVKKLDREFLTLTLAPKTLPTTFSSLVLSGRASAKPGANTTLQLAGEYHAVVAGQLLNDTAGMKGSEKGIPISTFRALERVALAYAGGRVTYGKQ